MDAPAGIDVAVTPATLTLGTGESADYETTFTTTEAATIGTFSSGSLTWSDGSHNVRSALAVRPTQASVPGELPAIGTEGSDSFEIGFGYSGEYSAAAHGMVPANTQAPWWTIRPTTSTRLWPLVSA